LWTSLINENSLTLYMTRSHNMIIAGAGGIARAVCLMLMELSKIPPKLFIGNRNLSGANEMAEWIKEGVSKELEITTFQLATDKVSSEMKKILEQADIILDCLPGSLAPKMAQLAKEYQLHYANLTEYVSETNDIIKLAKNAATGFVLQTGLAPGYIDVLGHKLFQDFCKDFQVEQVEKLELKVGALSRNAVAPHYYAFTWSPVGVATEYLKEAEALRDYKKVNLPVLSERSKIIIDGITYEDDLTSGGAADLPQALSGRVRSLDYKTLRHPGHYAWVEQQLSKLPQSTNKIKALQEKMEAVIPHLEDDMVVLYASVEGKDKQGVLRRREISKKILPQKVGKHVLRAIQTTTAAPLCQAAQMLLESDLTGVILQSQLDPVKFLNGQFVRSIFGK
jgi:saccharopine dehydrogenase-like NADP-dependent oxidoreductase